MKQFNKKDTSFKLVLAPGEYVDTSISTWDGDDMGPFQLRGGSMSNGFGVFFFVEKNDNNDKF